MRISPLSVFVAAGGLLAQAAPLVPLGTVLDAPFTDLHWQSRTLADLGPHAATVIYFATV
jgi:hypothetical protein